MSIAIDSIIRSRRKHLALQITPEGLLHVYAPRLMPQWMIHRLVEQQHTWIQKQRAKVQKKYGDLKPYTFVPGERFLFLGQSYTLTRGPYIGHVHIQHDCILVPERYTSIKEALQAWYRRQARTILTDRVQIYAAEAGIQYFNITITSANTRWGSCSSEGNLSFSWKLIMAPQEVVDYVVVHELAHRKEMNHSPRFWAVVEDIMPDYKEYKTWLRTHGHTLRFS